MTSFDIAQSIRVIVNDRVIQPVQRLILGLDQGDRAAFYGLLATVAVLGFVIGRLRAVRADGRWRGRLWRIPIMQNRGEALVSRVLASHFGAPDYHLMNHVTLRTDDGTTQIDHVLVSMFGVFVIETKDYKGWIFASTSRPRWTQVLFGWKFRFQNPLLQNYRHVCAVRALLDFLPPEAIVSVVVFTDAAEFKTDVPAGVTTVSQLPDYIRQHNDKVISRNRQQFCVGRLETARLAISRQTDIEHVESLARRFGTAW